ncbi:MAG: hypothetical protein ACLVJ6_14300 [Merdibacter sp.]
MTGQDIVNVAQSFHDQLSVTGHGADQAGWRFPRRRYPLGIPSHVPVMFVGPGEKIDDLDVFHPSRMADRILGMGDMLTLIEQAQERWIWRLHRKVHSA